MELKRDYSFEEVLRAVSSMSIQEVVRLKSELKNVVKVKGKPRKKSLRSLLDHAPVMPSAQLKRYEEINLWLRKWKV